MEFRGDERGQPVQVGFILVLGILVLAFAGYQGFVVPQQNADVEFTHFQDVENQFAGFQSNLVNAVDSEGERAASFDLGLQYPSRLLALNPPPVGGSLRTTDARAVTVEVGTDDVTAGVCGSSDATSRSLVYSPNYNEFDNVESITYENTFVAKTYREGTVYGDQQLVRSVEGGPDRIDLLLLTGSVSETRAATYNLEINGTHRYSTTVTNPTVTLPSQFPVATWRNEILAERSDVSVSGGGDGRVTLAFDGGDYRVSCAVAGLNREPAFVPPTDEETASDVNRTFDTQWRSVVVDGESRTSTDGRIAVEPGDSVDLTVGVDGRSSGLPVDDPLVDYAFAYDVQNDASYDFSTSSRKITGGEDTITLTVPDSNEATDGDVFDAYTTAGDDSDVVGFRVEAGQAQRASVESATATEQQNRAIEFELRNDGSSGVTITGVSVDDTTNPDAESVLRDGGPELEQDAGAGGLDSELRVGAPTQPLDTNAEIAAGDSDRFTLGTFVDTNGDQVRMNNEETTITLVFSDGSSAQFVLTT